MSRENDPDFACMVRLVEGDDLALNELMERWQKPLFTFVLRYAGNETDSIEIAQETFVRVYHNRNRFNFKSKFSTWMFTIAANLCRNNARWRRRHPTIALEELSTADEESEGPFSSSEEETPSALAERAETAKIVREEINKLPHDLKTATILFEYENLSYDEIGEILGCTPKAVETRLYRARKLLKSKLLGLS